MEVIEVRKRPFLRKGTGLKRYYKDMDFNISSHFEKFTYNENNDHTESTVEETPNSILFPAFHFKPSTILHNAIKAPDSPKRHLNVRFASDVQDIQMYSQGKGKMNHVDENQMLEWMIENEDEEGSCSGEDDWETEDEEDDDDEEEEEESELNLTKPESLVEFEINESAMAEIFASMNQRRLSASASRDLFPNFFSGMDSSYQLGTSIRTSTPDTEKQLEYNNETVDDDVDEDEATSPSLIQKHDTESTKHNHHHSQILITTKKENENAEVDISMLWLLRTRINELEIQIGKHKRLNSDMTQMRSSLEAEKKTLADERKEFEEHRKKELDLLQELKNRLKDDHRKLTIAEKNDKTKKEENENLEILQLRSKVSELENDMKVRSGRWASSARNYKKTIKQLEEERTKLKNEIDDLKSRRYAANHSWKPRRMIPFASNSQLQLQQPITTKETIPEETQSHDHTNKSTHTAMMEALKNNEEKKENATPVQLQSQSPGTMQIMSEQGDILEYRYENGDIKDLRDFNTKGITKYFYKEAETWEITRRDGTQILQFPNGDVQIQKPNGIKEFKYSNGIVRRIYPDGREECGYPVKNN